MPVSTRRQRRQRNSPLPPFDLDPHHSNRQFPRPEDLSRRLTRSRSLVPPADESSLSPLSSLSPSPEPPILSGLLIRMDNRAGPPPSDPGTTNSSPPSPWQSARISPVESEHGGSPVQTLSVASVRSSRSSRAKSQQSTPRSSPSIPFTRNMFTMSPRGVSQSTLSSRIKPPERQKVKDFTPDSILKADGSNYMAWYNLQLLYLEAYNWYGHASGTDKAPHDPHSEQFEVWQTVDRLTKLQIGSNMESKLFAELVSPQDTAAQLWKRVTKRFTKTTSSARSTAKRNLDAKKIQSDESFADHIAELCRLRATYINTGARLDDDEWHTVIVNSLEDHPQWSQLTTFGDAISDPDDLIAFLENKEARGFAKTRKHESALQAQTRGQNRNNRTRSRSAIQCPNCNRPGHQQQDCWAPGGGAVHKRPSTYKVPPDLVHKEHASLTAQIQQLEKQRAQLAYTPSTSSPRSVNPPPSQSSNFAMVATETVLQTDSWLLDSGVSSHMTNRRDNFSDFSEIPPLEIQTAHKDKLLYALARGTVLAEFRVGPKSWTVPIKDVLYVPNLTHNLLSLAKLDARGIEFKSKNGECFLSNSGITYARGTARDNQWVIDLSIKTQAAFLVSTHKDASQPLHVWHHRLAHIHHRRVQELSAHNIVDGLIITKQDSEDEPVKCEPCLFAKMPASGSPSKDLRAVRPGDVIHADLEFMGHPSFSGADISLKFVDEFSNYLWCHSMTSKHADAILSCWKSLVFEIRTQFSIAVKALHTDNGAEFVNKPMEVFNQENGIQQHITVPYRHEMNGRAERMNRTGADAVRAMLTSAQLPFTYWAEAYATFAYIHNRCGSSHVTGQAPFQVLYGRKPSVAHIRTFGCPAYARVAPQKRKKLDPKSRKLILVGYRHDAAYRLIDPETKQIVFSCDVTFDEFGTLSERPFNSPDRVRRSTRPTTPTTRARASKQQETTLHHLDGSPTEEECVFTTKVLGKIKIPSSVKDAMSSPYATEWHAAMAYEIGKLNEMGVWQVVERPHDQHIIAGMWVYAIKEQADGSVEFRARWVARGDSQVPGLEFGETFAASGDFIAARVTCALSASPDSRLVTLDINSAYLHSPLDHSDLLVDYPTGFSVPGFSKPTCRLQRALYGLRQGARAWAIHLTHKLSDIGYTRCISAPTVFYRADSDGSTIMATHVDDCTSACKSISLPRDHEANRLRLQLSSLFKFKEKDTREKANLLGMTIHYDEDNKRVKLSLGQKILHTLEKYNMLNCNTARTPMANNALSLFAADDDVAPDPSPWPYAQLVGELLWFATVLRIDIAFSVNVLARYLQRPKQIHWEAAKRVLRYLAGTQHLGIVYNMRDDTTLTGYADSDWAGDATDRKSVSGYVFMFRGGPVAWKSKKQTVVAKSTAEAEYIAASLCTQEAIWFRHFFQEIGLSFNDQPLHIHVDNNAAIQMTHNPVYLSKSKHIDIPVHHIRDEVAKRRVQLDSIDGANNPADILTKPLSPALHEHCIKLLGLL